MSSFTLRCSRCGIDLLSISQANTSALKRRTPCSICGTCGCSYKGVDDGVPVDQDGGLTQIDVSQPRIDSISPTETPSTGGATIRITGLGFSHSTPTVKFGGIEGTDLTVLDDTSLDVVAPDATSLLEDPPVDVGVDVSIENEFGSRASGGVLALGLTYQV